MVAKSGLQKEVLALYRTLLREACKKDRSMLAETPSRAFGLLLDETTTSTAHVRSDFRKQASKVSRKDFRTIEHKIRHGYKQIKLLQMPGVQTFRSW
mmetsp:Transcript_11227/g.28427  ORF Transcript_11227/g.28427 Transcript_11227/m.28427 type:complete len:97 (-) Transcript_11227:589-879(-)